MMGRWDETIASSKLANELFEFLQNEYFNKIKSEAKQGLIKKHIDSYNQYRINGNSMNFEAGYTNKGFRWFEEQKDFSLKDFILYHPETISHQVFDEAAKVISYPIITETLIENAPKQELYFCYACEGYAFGKYVAFLKEEQVDTEKSNPQQPSPIKLPCAPPGIFKPAREQKFYEVEKQFIEMRNPLYLDFTGRWVGTVDSLAEFIWCLKDLDFFISKSKRITRQEKDFFKNRYKLLRQIEQKTYPSLKVDFSKNHFKSFFSQYNIS